MLFRALRNLVDNRQFLFVLCLLVVASIQNIESITTSIDGFTLTLSQLIADWLRLADDIWSYCIDPLALH
jgi:hypothetical protein